MYYPKIDNDLFTIEGLAQSAIDRYVQGKIQAYNPIDYVYYVGAMKKIEDAQEDINYANWFAKKEGLGENYFDPEKKLHALNFYLQSMPASTYSGKPSKNTSGASAA